MVYVIELENGKYYVGWTKHYADRMRRHFEGRGSNWTKLHKPVRVVEKLNGGHMLERKKTLEYMFEYGWENVRGSVWCEIEMRFPPSKLFTYHCPWVVKDTEPLNYELEGKWE